MEGDVREVKRAAESIGREMKEKSAAKMREMAGALAEKGGMPKDILGIGDAMVEGIYGQAYRLYNAGKYREASQLFRLLIMLNSVEPKYCMGMAACCHMLKEYAIAVQMYTTCGALDPENPVPHFHASDCYLQMEDPLSALLALEMAVKRAGEQPHYAVLKDRALLTMASLREEIAREKE